MYSRQNLCARVRSIAALNMLTRRSNKEMEKVVFYGTSVVAGPATDRHVHVVALDVPVM